MLVSMVFVIIYLPLEESFLSFLAPLSYREVRGQGELENCTAGAGRAFIVSLEDCTAQQMFANMSKAGHEPRLST